MEPLDAEVPELLLAARRAKPSAYAPYSNFSVGAAVKTESGKVFSGCNVENASYGLSICAERVAIFAAVAQGARCIEELSVSTASEPAASRSSRMPCGACRQVMAEFMAADAKVIIDGVGIFELAELLPVAFSLVPGNCHE